MTTYELLKAIETKYYATNLLEQETNSDEIQAKAEQLLTLALLKMKGIK